MAIECENLSVKFGEHTALEGIDLKIPDGAFISIVGPNGGGKSTFIKTVLGLIEPTSGIIRVFDQAPQAVPLLWIGYIPQIKTIDRTFPALSVELVANGITGTWEASINKKIRKKALEALERVGALHLEKRRLSRLSGGELQRIYLARIIARQPKLLLLDEPATGIDSAGENEIRSILEKFSHESKATVLMVTHDWEEAYHHADYVLLLNSTVINFDTPDKAFSENSMRKLFGHVGHAHEMFFGVKKND